MLGLPSIIPGQTLPYHIRFLREDPIADALRSHPFDGQFDSSLLVLSEVILSYINTLRESKVSNFDDEININPAYIKLITPEFYAAHSVYCSVYSPWLDNSEETVGNFNNRVHNMIFIASIIIIR